MRAPALAPALGLIAGILVAPRVPPLAAAGTAGAASLAALVAWIRDRQFLSLTCALAASLACGALIADAEHDEIWHGTLWQRFSSLPRDTWDAQLLTGVLVDDPVLLPYGAAFGLSVERIGEGADRVQGGVRVTVGGSEAAALAGRLAAGDRVVVPVRLRAPSNYGDPGASDRIGSLARDGIVLTGSAKSALLIELIEHGGWTTRVAAAGRRSVRRAIRESFTGAGDQQAAAIVAAILIGDRGALSDETIRDLQGAGTFHVIAISGGNIAILVMLCLVALQWARVPFHWQHAVLIPVVVVYGGFVSGGASVTRAVVMATVYLIGRMLDVRAPAMNSLAWAAVVVLAWKPGQLGDLGFQLTFVATLAIVAIAPLVPLRRLPRARAAAALLMASAAAEAGLLPIGASAFHRVTFAGLLLNFIAIPVMTIIQALGIALVLVCPLSAALARACAMGARVACEVLTRSAALATYVPLLSYRVAAPAWPIIVLYYLAAAGLVLGASGVCRTSRGRRVLLALVWIGSAGVIAAGPLRSAPADRLAVTFLDVGQGSATLVEFPRGETMVVDAGGTIGGSFDVGEAVVSPVLWAHHLRRLDDLVLTHGDPDHAAGMPALLRNFVVGNLVEAIPVEGNPELGAIADSAARARVPIVRRHAGDGWSRGGVEIRVLNPPPPDWERRRVRNDDSLVLELDYGRAAVLLTGDISDTVEQDLVRRGALARFQAAQIRVLAVPHHGSRTSSSQAFLDAARPTLAVVSAGRDNWFGHPAAAVLARYEAAGVPLLRTDRDGAVTVTTDGERVAVDRFRTSGR